MANQDISLTNYDPDAAKIQRQQRLAQMLQEQSQQDIPIQSYNGVQAPISPFSLIAKALQAYQGKKLADKADTQYGDLQAQRRQQLVDMLSKQNTVSTPVNPNPASPGQYDAPNLQSSGPSFQMPQGQTAQYDAPSIAPKPLMAMNRPATMDEQLANALTMSKSRDPQAANIGMQLYQAALKKQQMAPVISALPQGQQAYAGALMNADPSAGTSFANTIQEKGFEAGNRAPDANLQDYKIAQGQGFKGSYLDFRKQLAQTTHISVDTGAHGWQVAVDPTTQTQYRYNPNTGQSTSLDGKSAYVPGGYGKVATPNMRNPVAIYMDSWSKEHPGASAADKLTAMNSFAGQQATARTLGNIEGKVGSAANGLDIMAGQANDAYSKLGRGNFVPFNKLQQMASTNAFSSPEQADAYAADTGVINLWGKAINPSGVLTVEAQKRGEQMLSQAQSPEAHAAVLARMVAESRASKAGVSQSQAGIGRNLAATPIASPANAPRVVHWNDLK